MLMQVLRVLTDKQVVVDAAALQRFDSSALAVLLAHREEAQATRRPEDELPLEQQKAWRLAQLVEGVSAEEAFDRIGYRPFHWRSVEECWQLLTGQTVLPEGAERIMQEGRR